MTVTILDIQRMSTEDGPGLRTTVFFKGCNLRCPWCHNPESIGRKPELNWLANKCMGCGTCAAVCAQGVISRDTAGVHFDRSKCIVCGHCVDECPVGAIELKGKSLEVEKLFLELIKDRSYFGTEGGITLSGGEVMLQTAAAQALAKLLKEAGIHVAVDTAGCYDFKVLEAMLPYMDMALYDIKIFDAARHEEIVGGDNRLVLENYRKLRKAGMCLWVRTPIIAGATDSAENIRAIGGFLREAGLPEKWELCSFNNLCRDKYTRLDLDWAYKTTGLTEKKYIEELTAIARGYVPGAMYSGTTKEE
jgi:pyruvate formate lyase activating enzyme